MTEPLPESTEEQTVESKGSPGSIHLGPLVISAKFSIVLIYFIILGFNVLLILGVVLAALHRAGRL